MRKEDTVLFEPLGSTAERMRDGRLSPVELTERCLERIEALGGRLNAFITVTAELARARAVESEAEMRAGRWRGALHGVPVAVKDFYDTAGIRTTAGSAQFLHRVPSRDAALVGRLREAGAVLVGKTNMHELGRGTTSLVSHFGAVVNPRSSAHVAGGSSGGSAAAVAAGLCFVTVDTDAVGSGRLPAAICGVTCHKPTFGMLSTAGILAGEPVDPAIGRLAHACLMARSAEEVSLAFGVLRERTGETAPGGSSNASRRVTRLGVVTNFAGTAEIRKAFTAAVAAIRHMGLVTRDIEVPFDRASFDVSNIDEDRAEIDALLFGDVDALVLPTLAAPTPSVEDARARGDLAVSPENTFFCNYYGLPAITIPWRTDHDGLPLGLQFVGPRHGDDRVLALASEFQRTTGWRYSPPEC